MLLNFRNPVKDFSSYFLLRNGDNSDVRLYELRITVLPRPMKAILEFETSARLPLAQKIPVSNPLPYDVMF